MKKQLLFVALLALSATLNAQINSRSSIGTLTPSSTTNIFPLSGNAGIGTLTPSQALEIITSLNNDGIKITQSGIDAVALQLNSISGHNYGLFSYGSSSPQNIGAFSIYDYTASTPRFYITPNGLTGIGTTTPNSKLNVSAAIGVAFQIDHTNSTTDYNYAELINVQRDFTKALVVQRVNGATGITVFQIWGNGQTRIGVKSSLAHPDAYLMVDGKIVCKDFYVTALNDWPDYVFGNAYKLPDLYDIQKYYQTHKHLPGVPTAGEIKEKGINLGQMIIIEMQKIEELTMYIIQLKTEIGELKKESTNNR